MATTYTFQEFKENMSRAKGIDLPISTKQSIEVCNYLRGRWIEKSIAFLKKVEKGEAAVPYKRFNKAVGHKKGIGPGRYPLKTSREIRKILQSAQTNAQSKGLSTTNLKILHINANKASTPLHYGRRPRREMKRTHIEVVLVEAVQPEKKGKKKAVVKEQPKAAETKPAESKPAEHKAEQQKPAQAKPESKPAPVAVPKTEPKPEPKPEAQPSPKPAAEDKPEPAKQPEEKQ